MRNDRRDLGDLRPIRYETGYLEWAEGSVLLEMGKTRVLCAASYDAQVPRFLQGTGKGWVTAGTLFNIAGADQHRRGRRCRG